MGKQFFYTREEKDKKYLDSFNLNNVLRSIELADGRRIVLLDDIHERVEQVPDQNSKGQPNGRYKNQRRTVQSEITLSVEDNSKFVKECDGN